MATHIQPGSRFRRTACPVRRLALAPLLAALLLPAARGADADPVDAVEKSAAQWVKIRVETSRIEAEWQAQHGLLQSTVDALGDRAQTLEANQGYLEAKTAKEREELAGLDAANKQALSGLQAVEDRVRGMSARLARMRPSLPPRLSAALEMSYRSLASPALPVAERMQLNMTIINRCNQFNRSILSEEEIVDVAGDGNARLMEVLYWGLSHGYALDRSSGTAWLGSPGPQGWRWEPHPEAAGSVARLIAIYHDRADPEFVAVPARLAHPGADGPAK